MMCLSIEVDTPAHEIRQLPVTSQPLGFIISTLSRMLHHRPL